MELILSAELPTGVTLKNSYRAMITENFGKHG
jgi:hypothetical protein